MHGGSREYTLCDANTFALMKHKLLRHMHEWRHHHAYYNVVLRWRPSTERESLLVQTLNNIIQIKAKALGHRKKTVQQVVASGAPWQFHKILSWFKVDGRIIANLIRLLFSRGCSLLDDQHSYAVVLGCNRYLS